MDQGRIRYFLAVCEHGSFTAAAQACGVSQPSITMGVRRLERALGATLFERRHRPVRLTPLGAELHPLLQEVQAASERVVAVATRRLHEPETCAPHGGNGGGAGLDAEL
jgi:LysR family transcriptional regulator, hydrogen peroxide-inducible genes activator